MSDIRSMLADAGLVLQRHCNGERRTACPKCDTLKHRPRDSALAIRIDDRGFVALCHRCGWTVARSHRGAPHQRQIKAPRGAAADSAVEERIAAARRLWSEAIPIAGTLGERYLRGRAIPGPLPECLRYHPSCWHGQLRAKRPAMLGLMRDIVSNEVCGVHRTYLAANGSTKITDATAKMMLGRAKGAAIKLTADEAVTMGLGICEGIETGLSVMQAGWPIWAVGSAGSIAEFPVLSGIECLTVFADADETGQRAAEACAKRWAGAGREASIVTPKMAGDWNDWARGAA